MRLSADRDLVLSRLTKRHENDDDALRWHARRHPELAGILDQAGFEGELTIDTSRKSVADVLQKVIAALVG